MKEKKARVEDALHATRAAVEEGIVPGGGVALTPRAAGARRAQGRATSRSSGVRDRPPRDRGAPPPDRQNAGAEGSIVVKKVREGKGDFGYNAATDEYGDLLRPGVIDPAKVVRTALQNAASWPRCSSPPRRSSPTSPRRRQGRPAGGGGGAPDYTDDMDY